MFPIPENGRLVIAEGIETALAARELYKAYDWGLYAALSANSMEKFQFLNGIKEIVIIADNDTPRPVGYRAAYDLAMRAIKQGIAAAALELATPVTGLPVPVITLLFSCAYTPNQIAVTSGNHVKLCKWLP